MFSFPLFLTIYAGFTHAFETDHLLAVSNIVTQRNNIRSSMKDGIFWGLGHASTIFVIGVLMIIFKVGISAHSFHFFEAAVGLMLIALAVYRLVKFFGDKPASQHSRAPSHMHAHPHEHGGENETLHVHVHNDAHPHSHKLAYGVGLVHGLAGSGVLVLLAMSQIRSPLQGLIYLLVFGGGCVVGMLVAAGLFSVPFSKNIIQSRVLQICLILVSCGLCLVYGGKVIYENLLS